MRDGSTVLAVPVELYRAVRNLSVRIENDPEEMVQQQLARLRFMLERLPLNGSSILEFGCGSGLNAAYLLEHASISRYVGFDFSSDAVALARTQYPTIEFLQGDGCDRDLNINAGHWDLVFSTEVLEHVPDTDAFVANMNRHLRPGGVLFLSTPNRDIFSLGHEPSPINREHIKEPNRSEFESLLSRHLRNYEIVGQRFSRPALLEAWKRETERKIVMLQSGLRWPEATPEAAWKQTLRRNIVVRTLWSVVRRSILEPWRAKRALKSRPYSFADFEFSSDTSDALWFCAIGT